MQKPTWFSISFFKDWALWTLSLASGGPTVVIALLFFLQGKEPPKSGLLTVLGACSLVAACGAGLRERRQRIQTETALQENRQAKLSQRPALTFDCGPLNIPMEGYEGRYTFTVLLSNEITIVNVTPSDLRLQNHPDCFIRFKPLTRLYRNMGSTELEYYIEDGIQDHNLNAIEFFKSDLDSLEEIVIVKAYPLNITVEDLDGNCWRADF